MKIWIVFGSKFGQAEAVSHRVGERLRAHGHSVTITKGDHVPSSFRVEDCDVVLIAASMILGRYQRYIRDFVEANIAALDERATGFISVSGAAPETSPEWRAETRAYVDAFLRRTSWSPRWTAAFSGALRYTRYGFVVRWVMKRISKRTGGPTDTSRDYEFTDWEAVDRFAEEVASALPEGAPTRAAARA